MNKPITLVASLVPAVFVLIACTGGGGGGTLGTGDGGTSTPTGPGTGCTDSAPKCEDGTVTACEDGQTKTASCEEQCTGDGFTPASGCSPKFPQRCACGGELTDKECEKGVNATCTCLDTLPACQGEALLDTYIRCHRDPSSETAQILKCFAGYLVGEQVECNGAITKCGSSAPSGGCTADVDCGKCERCERSTGKCLTRVGCN